MRFLAFWRRKMGWFDLGQRSVAAHLGMSSHTGLGIIACERKSLSGCRRLFGKAMSVGFPSCSRVSWKADTYPEHVIIHAGICNHSKFCLATRFCETGCDNETCIKNA
jgi:hypothetical protein